MAAEIPDPDARITTHEFAIQTERGMETNRLCFETLQRRWAAQKADRCRDGLPSNSEDSDDGEDGKGGGIGAFPAPTDA